jgi:hypothetical protein
MMRLVGEALKVLKRSKLGGLLSILQTGGQLSKCRGSSCSHPRMDEWYSIQLAIVSYIQTIEVTACMRPVSKCGHSFLRKPQGDSTTAKASQSSFEQLLLKFLMLMFILGCG